MRIIENQTFDAERALYASNGVTAVNCSFDGPADGESAFKESSNIVVDRCFFNLRYPFWHNNDLRIVNSQMTSLCRAALWYCEKIEITDSKLHGIKALRECNDIKITDCDIISPEFGWSVKDITMENSTVVSEYFMLRSQGLNFNNVKLQGKYSFQYINDAFFENCEFDTKDAFWHAENAVVRNSVVKGEYLAWYCKNVTFENCVISGTQPFCYCEGLKLINCKLLNADLCFEKSNVDAVITTPVLSIKNPLSGNICVPSVEEIILDDPEATADIVCGERNISV